MAGFLAEIAALNKAYDEGLDRGDIVSTGCMGLDLLFHGGTNFGSIHEFYGESKTGKSLVMAMIGREVQRKYKDGIVVILDRENAHPTGRLWQLGLDPERTIRIPAKRIPFVEHAYTAIVDHLSMIEQAARGDKGKPKTKKEGENLIGRVKLVKASPRICFITDSLPSFAEGGNYVEDQGRRAKAWHAVLRRLTGALDAKVMMLFSNQVTYSPQAYGGGAVKTTGVAMDYYRDSGVELIPRGDITTPEGVVCGMWIEAKVPKTRRGPQYTKTLIPLRFAKNPIEHFSGVLGFAEYLGLAELSNKTAWKDRNKNFDIWPNYKCMGKAINERDPEVLRDFLRETQLLQALQDKQEEIFGESYDWTSFLHADQLIKPEPKQKAAKTKKEPKIETPAS